LGFIFELQKKVCVIKLLGYEEREVWWDWSGSLKSVLVVLKSSLWMREGKVGHESEFTIFAFYINTLTASWICILSKGNSRAGRVKWMQQSVKQLTLI